MGSRMGSNPFKYQKMRESAPYEFAAFITQNYGQQVMVRCEKFPARHFLDKYRRFNLSCELVYAEAKVGIRGYGYIKFAVRDPFCYWCLENPRDWKRPETIEDDKPSANMRPWKRALAEARKNE